MGKLQLVVLAILGIFTDRYYASPFGKGIQRLIKTSDNETAKWVNESEIRELIEAGKGFMDFTYLDHYFEEKMPPIMGRSKGIPTKLKYQEQVRHTFENIDLPRMESFVEDFTRFFNRYYDDPIGVASEQWLYRQVAASVQGYSAGSVSLIEWTHGWPLPLQKSIIVRINGSDEVLQVETVILGAHQDSINIDGASKRAPGADDNASGCIALLEALRAIVSAQIMPKRSLEFHWYAAEEEGLIGSLDISRRYRREGRNVAGMINLDVVGYYVEGADDVAIITDWVDSELTQFLRLLVDEYLDFGRRERECGYACSDHAAWTDAGYPAARPTQAVHNGQMHTVNDTINTISFVQIREFVKLALGFAIELAEL